MSSMFICPLIAKEVEKVRENNYRQKRTRVTILLHYRLRHNIVTFSFVSQYCYMGYFSRNIIAIFLHGVPCVTTPQERRRGKDYKYLYT